MGLKNNLMGHYAWKSSSMFPASRISSDLRMRYSPEDSLCQLFCYSINNHLEFMSPVAMTFLVCPMSHLAGNEYFVMTFDGCAQGRTKWGSPSQVTHPSGVLSAKHLSPSKYKEGHKTQSCTRTSIIRNPLVFSVNNAL